MRAAYPDAVLPNTPPAAWPKEDLIDRAMQGHTIRRSR